MLGGGAVVATARTLITVDDSQLGPGLASAEAQTERAATGMRTSLTKLEEAQIKVRLAQDSYTKSVARFGPESVNAQRSLLRLSTQQRELAQATQRSGAELESGTRHLGRFGAGARGAEHDLGRLSRGALAGTGIFRSLGRSVAFASAGFLGGYGLTAALAGAFGEMEAGIRAGAQTSAVLKSTGAVAGVTAKDIDTLALAQMRLSGVDDELIKQGENWLLTFRQVRNEAGKGNDIFNQATLATLNLARAQANAKGTSVDMAASANLVGKALNDPIRGMTALTRVGVTFDEQQRHQIKTFMAAGDIMSAQKVILHELNLEVGGTAKAYGDTLPGSISRAREVVRNLSASLLLDLGPAIQSGADRLTAWADEQQKSGDLQRKFNTVIHDGGAIIQGFIGVIRGVAPIVQGIVGAVGGWKNATEGLLALKVVSVLSGWASSFTVLAGTEAAGTGIAGASGAAAVLKKRLGALSKLGPIAIVVGLSLVRTNKVGQSELDRAGIGWVGKLPLVGHAFQWEARGVTSAAEAGAFAGFGVPAGGRAQPTLDLTAKQHAITTTAIKAMSGPYARYVWGGGHDPKPGPTTSLGTRHDGFKFPGFDCSGFVRYVMAQNGISVPGTSQAQAAGGVPVPLDQLAPGDLVFTEGWPHPGHVGIYIGNGEIIHDPHTGASISTISVGDFGITGARRYWKGKAGGGSGTTGAHYTKHDPNAFKKIAKPKAGKTPPLIPYALQLPLEEAGLTKSTKDDLAALTAIDAYLVKRIRLTSNIEKKVALVQELESVRGQEQSIVKVKPGHGSLIPAGLAGELKIARSTSGSYTDDIAALERIAEYLRKRAQVGQLFKLQGSHPGLVSPGNIDLLGRKVAHNGDGTISTVKSLSIEVDGKEVLIPMVINGKVVTPEEAIASWRRTGRNLGTFASIEAANAYAQALHDEQAKVYGAGGKGGSKTPADRARIGAQLDKTLTDLRIARAKQATLNEQNAAKAEVAAINAKVTAEKAKVLAMTAGGSTSVIDIYGDVDPAAVAAAQTKADIAAAKLRTAEKKFAPDSTEVAAAKQAAGAAQTALTKVQTGKGVVVGKELAGVEQVKFDPKTGKYIVTKVKPDLDAMKAELQHILGKVLPKLDALIKATTNAIARLAPHPAKNRQTLNQLRQKLVALRNERKGYIAMARDLRVSLDDIAAALAMPPDSENGASGAGGSGLTDGSQTPTAPTAVDIASHGESIANAGLSAMQTRQQLNGTAGTPGAFQAQADYVTSTVLPSMQGVLFALGQQLQDAYAANDEGLALQIGDAIAAKQNDILTAQLTALQDIEASTAAAVSSATHGETMATIAQRTFELQQQISGTDQAGGPARAAFIQTTVIPAMQGVLTALQDQYRQASADGNQTLADQIAEAIGNKQNDILSAQLTALQDIKAAIAQDNANQVGYLTGLSSIRGYSSNVLQAAYASRLGPTPSFAGLGAGTTLHVENYFPVAPTDPHLFAASLEFELKALVS